MTTVVYEAGGVPQIREGPWMIWMICDHAADCNKRDCEWWSPKRHIGNLYGHCSKRDIFVKIIPYTSNGKKDPNLAFRMRKE